MPLISIFIFKGCQFLEHTVQLTRRNQEIWGPIPQIYDDLLTFQVLICTDSPPEADQQLVRSNAKSFFINILYVIVCQT